MCRGRGDVLGAFRLRRWGRGGSRLVGFAASSSSSWSKSLGGSRLLGSRRLWSSVERLGGKGGRLGL